MDAVVQSQQCMYLIFFHYYYLKLGVVQMKSVLHLRQSFSYPSSNCKYFHSMRCVPSSWYSHTFSSSLQPFASGVAHGFSLSTRKVGEIFLYLLLLQQPFSSRHCEPDTGFLTFCAVSLSSYLTMSPLCSLLHTPLLSPSSSPSFSVPLQTLLLPSTWG